VRTGCGGAFLVTASPMSVPGSHSICSTAGGNSPPSGWRHTTLLRRVRPFQSTRLFSPRVPPAGGPPLSAFAAAVGSRLSRSARR
jgi:hypothetical protein